MAALMASSSSGAGRAAMTERGIRIMDGPEERRRRMAPWVSPGLDGEDDGGEEEAGVEAALARARGCDVYVGHGGGARRMVAWLRAELELLGVPCVASDRRRCGDALAHAAARAAMDVAAAGVVVVTPASLANPYAVEEIRVFLGGGALVPVLVGLGRGDLAAEDVVERRGELWGAHGGHLWKLYDGAEAEWREAVEGLARADPLVVVRAGEVRDCVLDVLEILGARLGRRALAAAVKAWRAAADPELPFPRNVGFVGREKELLDMEAMLRGGLQTHGKAAGKMAVHLDELVADDGPFMDGVVCISGMSGSGKTELALEFAHKHAHEYKKVLWVHGEGRYLRQSYLKLADHLGLAVGDDVPPSPERSRSLHEIEGDAIAKIRKELTRDIPYLVVIDNLESDKDWWDGTPVQELLPRGGKRTHVVVTTRLGGRLHGVRRLPLGNLAASEAMLLMKGTRTFSTEDMAVLRSIEEKVGSTPLGLALVGAILSELPIGPAELRHAMSGAPHRAPTWAAKDDPALRDNPGLAQLLDACFVLLGREKAGLGAAAARLLEASSFFAPAPIPLAMLASAASACAAEESLWKWLMRSLQLTCTTPGAGQAAAEAPAVLLRLGIFRSCTEAGCVSVHAVFRLFSRKVGSGQVGRSVVRAIAAQAGGAERRAEHTWAACMSLFRFEAPAAAVQLPPPELARFVARSVLPLAAHAVAAYSAYSAALELLREATDAVSEAEDRYVAAPPRRGGASSSNMDLDPRVYQELARGRAELLKARARMMARAGEHGIAEDHCLAAIGILEVVCGDAHPEAQAVRAFLEQITVRVQTMN